MALTSGGRSRVDALAYYGVRYLAQTGQSLYLAALLIAAGSGSSVALGLSSIMAATMAGPIVFGLLAGSLGDRLGPGRGYAIGAAARLIVVSSGLLVLGRPEFAWVVAFSYSSVSQLFSPSEMALVPLIESRAPARAHTLLVMLQYAGQATGLLVLAPLLFLFGGPALLLTGAAVVYVGVSTLALVVALRVRSREAEYRAPTRHAFSLRESVSYITHDPRATYAFGLLAFVDMAMKCAVIALPAYLIGVLDLSRVGLAVIAAPGIVGVAIGMLWVSRQFDVDEAPRVMRMTFLGTVVSVLALAALDHGLGLADTVLHAAAMPDADVGISTGMLVAFPAALLLGICVSVAPIGARAVLSATAPHGQQARVFASQATFAEVLIILPLLLAGLGTEFAGPQATFGFVAFVGVSLLLLLEGATASVPSTAAPRAAEVPLP